MLQKHVLFFSTRWIYSIFIASSSKTLLAYGAVLENVLKSINKAVLPKDENEIS